jgi:hypothetical protein
MHAHRQAFVIKPRRRQAKLSAWPQFAASYF